MRLLKWHFLDCFRRFEQRLRWRLYSDQFSIFLCSFVPTIQPLDILFLLFYISFYVSRYHFSQIFRTSFNIFWKKDFCHKFSFFNRFTPHPPPSHPLNGQNPLSVTKVFCRWSLSHVTITFEYIIACHFLKMFLKTCHDDALWKLQIYTHSVF